MDPGRIAELLEPFLNFCDSEERSDEESAVLSTAQLADISTYIDILQRWNARINLTAIRSPEQVVTRHFGESLFAARHLFPVHSREAHGFSRAVNAHNRTQALVAAANGHRPATNDRPAVADVGSGAGFPGIPIKLWAPEISLTLIESNHKKATFLREVARALTLTDINIQNARAESLPPASYDVVTLRAVERFESILPIAADLVKPTGRLALLIGSGQCARAHSSLPTLSWSDPLPIPTSTGRVMLVGRSAA